MFLWPHKIALTADKLLHRVSALLHIIAALSCSKK